MNPWDRQKGETTKAFQAFVIYRDMKEDRTLAKTGKTLGKSATLMEDWSAKWGWVSRCAAFDAMLDAERIKEQLKQQRAMVEMHALIGKQGMSIAARKMNAIITTNDDPETDDLPKWIETMSKLQRQSLGMPTETIKTEHEEKTTGEIPWSHIPLKDRVEVLRILKEAKDAMLAEKAANAT